MKTLCAFALAAGIGTAIAQTPLVQPESSSGWNTKAEATHKTYAIAAANPLAAEAGRKMLARGGSAVDAAIAAQMVLTLVEPQSSGIGGGASLLHFDGKTTQAFDGRETAPMGAKEDLFLDAQGKPVSRSLSVVGGRSVGVPGVLRMLYLAHQQHGRLPWPDLFAPAIALAQEGFLVSPRMAKLLRGETQLRNDADAAAYFYDEKGTPRTAGHLLRNPELAAMLQLIASQGPDGMMTGPIAQAMVRKVRDHANPGSLSLDDLRNYQAKSRKPECFVHPVKTRTYRICGMGAPSSGQIAMAQIFGVLDHTNAATLPLDSAIPTAQWLHLYTEAARLAFADRAQYVADPDFVEAPAGAWDSLWEPGYLRGRARLIDTRSEGLSMGSAQAGHPGKEVLAYAPMPDQPEAGTSHLSVMDRYGNVVAMTTSIEDGWGARILVNRGVGLKGGFLLNNQLTDFSLQPTGADGKPVANRVQPGKRPRSTMAPTLVFDETGNAMMALGSPGGALIAHFVAKTLYARLHWQLPLQDAVNLPNFGSINGPTFLEAGRFGASTLDALNRRNHQVQQFELPSGLQALERSPAGIVGAADPRREGQVLGD